MENGGPWNSSVPECSASIIKVVADAILNLCGLAKEMKETRKVSDKVECWYHYMAILSSMDPHGLKKLRKAFSHKIEWKDILLSDSPEVAEQKAWHLAKAIIEQSGVVFRGYNELYGVGIEVTVDGQKLLLMHQCQWRWHGSETVWE